MTMCYQPITLLHTRLAVEEGTDETKSIDP